MKHSKQIVKEDAVFDQRIFAGARVIGRRSAGNDKPLANAIQQDGGTHRRSSAHRPLGMHLALLLAVGAVGLVETAKSLGSRWSVNRGGPFDQELPVGAQIL